jgi:hypothetical protein
MFRSHFLPRGNDLAGDAIDSTQLIPRGKVFWRETGFFMSRSTHVELLTLTLQLLLTPQSDAGQTDASFRRSPRDDDVVVVVAAAATGRTQHQHYGHNRAEVPRVSEASISSHSHA